MPLNFIAHADTMVKQEDTYAYSKKSTYLPNSKLNWCYSYTLQNPVLLNLLASERSERDTYRGNN